MNQDLTKSSIPFQFQCVVHDRLYQTIETIADEFAKRNHIALYHAFIEECGRLDTQLKYVNYFTEKYITYCDAVEEELINSGMADDDFEYRDTLSSIYEIMLARAATETKVNQAAAKYLPMIGSNLDLEKMWEDLAIVDGAALGQMARKANIQKQVNKILNEFHNDMSETLREIEGDQK